MHATAAGREAAANTHVATAELPACESTPAAKSSATEVTAAAKAAAVATAKTTAVASTAATMTAATAASPSSGEGVSLDRGHPHGDDRENDCYFAQHQNSPYPDALASLDFFPTRRASPRVLVGLPMDVGTRLLRVCARLPRLFECCGNQLWARGAASRNPVRPCRMRKIRPPCASTMEREIDGPIAMPSGLVG
jgi:hypothetical protein